MIVSLFRDLRAESWPSMDIYADKLAHHLSMAFPYDCRVKQVETRPLLPRLKGAFGTGLLYATRTVQYPLIARFRQGEINHIIDHTYGHLAHFLDAKRTIVTCHDLAPLVMRDALPRRSLGLSLWDWALRGMLKASHVIAVSENTRRDIVRLTDYPADKITVIPQGIAEGFRPIADPRELAQAAQRLGADKSPRIVHVGHCGQRKNIEVILKGLARVLRAGEKSVHFYQIGGRFSRSQLDLINHFGLGEHVTQRNHVPFVDLPLWYNLADVFVFPSHYEGFGAPPLEAMACGVPVVCSNTSCLPEMLGDAALAVDPDDDIGLAMAIERILDDSCLRKDITARGLEQASEFSWQKCARRTYQVYQQVMGEES